MNIFSAVVLGIVQGLTEFLPVSSSGHLVIFQKLIPGFSQPGILFDVILHFGTLAAVFYFFRKKIISLSRKYVLFLVIGTVPAVIAGVLFRKQFELMFSNPRFLGYELLVTGLLNFLVDLPVKKKVNLNIKNSLLIGVAQGVAIIPGISRSGATIFTGVRLGIDRQKIAEYSFILSIPAILGANLLEIISYGSNGIGGSLLYYIVGFIVSFIVGIASIDIVMKLLMKNKFKIFGYYTVLVGLLVIFFL